MKDECRSGPIVWDAGRRKGVSTTDVDTLVRIVVHDADHTGVPIELTIEQAKALRNRLGRSIKYAVKRREHK